MPTFTDKADGVDTIHAADVNAAYAVLRALNTATVVVAGSNAPSWVQTAANYVCDGTADQVEIQAAIDSLPTNTVDSGGSLAGHNLEYQGGGRITLIGRFNLSAGVHIQKDHVEIEGVYGHTYVSAVTGFTGSSMFLFDRDDLSPTRPAIYCSMTNLYLDGGGFGTTVTGIDFKVSRGRINNCMVYNMTQDGIVVRGDATTLWPAYANRVERCETYLNARYGYYFYNLAQDCFMIECEAHENISHGVRVEGASWMFEHCMFWGNHGNGLLIYGGVARTIVTSCKFEQNNGGLYTGGSGVYPSELNIVGCYFGSNGIDLANTYDDIQLAGSGGTPTGVSLISNQFGKPYATNTPVGGINPSATWANQSRYAVFVANGSAINIEHNVFGPVATWASGVIIRNDQAATVGAVTIRDNNGYNFPPSTTLADSTAIANTTTETAFSQTYTFPVWTMITGRVYRFRARGVYSTTTTAPTLRFKLRLTDASGTIVAQMPAAATTVISAVGRGWQCDIDISVRSGTALAVNGFANIATSNTAAVTAQMLPTTAASGGNPLTFDPSLTNVFVLTAQWGTANASNTITMQQFVVDVPN